MSANPPTVDDERSLLAAVARGYYLDGLSRTELGAAFGLSRFKITRMLTRARQEGIVTIEIHDLGLEDPGLARRLGDRLGLTRCHVVRARGDEAAVRAQIGSVAARVLSATLRDGEVLGLSWGRTLTATIGQIQQLPRLSIVQLTGSLAGDLDSSPIEVARQASNRSGGNVYPIFAPLLTRDRETADGLRDHPDIRAAFEMFPSVTTALLSVGGWGDGNSQMYDVLSLDELAATITGGCVGDIAGILIDARGRPVSPALQERCVTIGYDELLAVPRVMAVAGGVGKAKAVEAVARAGLVTELVTDHTLAAAVLGGTGA